MRTYADKVGISSRNLVRQAKTFEGGLLVSCMIETSFHVRVYACFDQMSVFKVSDEP